MTDFELLEQLERRIFWSIIVRDALLAGLIVSTLMLMLVL